LEAGQITIVIYGEEITPRSLTELCTALQDATPAEIFEIRFDVRSIVDVLFCLGADFGFDVTHT